MKILCVSVVVLILIIHMQQVQAVIAWDRPSDIRMSWIQMTSGQIYTSSNISTYNLVFSETLYTTPVSFAPSLIGFKTQVSTDFAFKVIFDNFTLTDIGLAMLPIGDTVFYLFQISYIATSSGDAFLQIIYECFLCSTLSTGNGTRSQSRNLITRFSQTTLQVVSFLSSFQMHNTQGINNNLYTSVTAPVGSNNITIDFSTSQNNTISSICYHIVVYNEDVVKAEGYFDIVRTTVGLTNNATGFGSWGNAVPVQFWFINREYYGIKSFNISRAIERIYRFGLQDLNNVPGNFESNIGIHEVQVSVFAAALRSCDPTQQFQVTTSTCQSSGYCGGLSPAQYVVSNPNNANYCAGCYYACNGCTGPANNQCSACETAYFRTNPGSNTCICYTGYIDVGLKNCIPCSVYIQGCVDCSSITSCNGCDMGMTLISGGAKCQCTSGFLISGICIEQYGCTSAVSYSGTDYCTSCNTTQHFVLNTTNHSCYCQTGYTFVSPICSNVCGDGILVSAQQCDDGNNINGDGCSSTCIVQTNWTCTSTNNSVCTILVNPTIQLRYVKRILNENKMRVALAINPTYSKYSNLQFYSMLTSNVPVTSYETKYQNNMLIIDYTYNQSIQGNYYYITLKLDPDYFTASSATIRFQASGMNAKLTYDSYNSHHDPLSIIVITICALALFIYIFGLFSEKMIGVQMIHTLQTVLFTMLLMQRCPSGLAPLQQLRYSNGYNFLSGSDNARTYTYNFRYSAIGIQKQFLLSYNLMYIFLIITIVLSFIMKCVDSILYWKYQNETAGKIKANLKSKMQKVRIALAFFFERCYFLIAMISLFMIVCSFAIQLTDMQPRQYLIPDAVNLIAGIVALVIMIVLTLILIANGLLYNSKIIRFIHVTNYYVPFYIVYQAILIVLIAFLYKYTVMIYVTYGFILTNIAFLIYLRPYKKLYHNIAIVFNQIVIGIGLGLYLIAQLSGTSDSNQILYILGCYLMIILLLIVIIFSCVRLFLQRSLQAFREINQEFIKTKAKKNQTDRTLQLENMLQYNGLRPKEEKQKLLNSIVNPYHRDGGKGSWFNDEHKQKLANNDMKFSNINEQVASPINKLTKRKRNSQQNKLNDAQDDDKNKLFESKTKKKLIGDAQKHGDLQQSVDDEDALTKIKRRLKKDLMEKTM